MMQLFSEWGFLLSLLVSLVALLVAGVALSRVRRQLEDARRLQEDIARQLALANSGSVGMGQRLLAMEKRLRESAVEASPAQQDDDDDFKAYAQAAQLFKLGISSEEVAQRCGLSRAEASLMEMMHKASS